MEKTSGTYFRETYGKDGSNGKWTITIRQIFSHYQVYRDGSDDAQMAELGPDDRDRPDCQMVSPLKMEQGPQTWPSRPWNWRVLANSWSYLGLICLNPLWLRLIQSTVRRGDAGLEDVLTKLCNMRFPEARCFERYVIFFREVKSWSVLLRLRQFGSQMKLLRGTICIGMTSGGPSSEAVPRTYPQWTDRFMGKRRVNWWT